ncbi:ATP-binding protein [Noviherbaspirillum aerium]|uniref:ATP-binding protein n=1 Tax=Noviherbaspirillum aerium TaxID=2588497 RepID=UPI00124BE423|nr:ATP-binding protein [Noviherbaspirillum aerium]
MFPQEKLGNAGTAVSELLATVGRDSCSLGNPTDWPQSLRTIVRLMTSSQFPMFVAWGPDLTFLYNDAYTQFLGEKHPESFGRPFKEVWEEIWPDIGPLVDKALEGEASFLNDMPLVIKRGGKLEQTWFTFSYSPAHDDTGCIAGMYCAVTETTARMLAERRQNFQLKLADSLSNLGSPRDIMQTACKMLGEHFSVGQVGYGEVDVVGVNVAIQQEWTNNTARGLAGRSFPLDGFGPEIIKHLRAGKTLRIDDVGDDERSAFYADAYASIDTRSLIVVPLLENSKLTATLYLHDSSPRHWTEEEQSIAEDVARRTWDALKRARAEQFLQTRERELSLVYSNVGDGVFYLEADDTEQFRFVSANPAFTRLSGISESAIIGQQLDKVLPPASYPMAREWGRKAIQSQTSVTWEEKIAIGTSTVYVQVSLIPVFNTDGKCRNLIGTVHDITASKKTEAALRDETRVLELLNKTGEAIASTLETDALLQAITDAATQLSGARFGAFFYNGKDEQGDAYLLYTLSGAPREAFEKFGHPRATALFGPTFKGAPAIRSDDITKDVRYGKWGPPHGMPPGHLPVRSYLALPVISRSGEVYGGLFFGHPEVGVFTERAERLVTGVAAQAAIALDNARLFADAQRATRERESLLERERFARAEAERLNSMKDEFVAMLAHELRNPLAPISSAAELLNLLYVNEPKIRNASEIIGRQVAHIRRLVDDLLDVSRVTRGLVKLEKKPVDFREIISGAIDQVMPLIREKGHAIYVQTPSEPVWVEGDPTRLVQAVSNILNNAAKYTHEDGSIKVSLNVASGSLGLSIQDNGIGIPPDLLPSVFDLFTQGARTLARSQGGLGLGLTLVKRLVELHGGRVDVTSSGIGTGSEFFISLPLSRNDANSHEGRSSGSIEVTDAHMKLQLMVIDDNVDAADSLGAVLRAQGHNVVTRYSGYAALDALNEGVPDAFLIDIGLPDIDGFELAKQLRALPETSDALLIAVTGYGQPKDKERAKAAGFSHHLVKPVDVGAVTSLLTQERGGKNTHSVAS